MDLLDSDMFGDHLHLLDDSQALDADGDGFSDAVERDLGTDWLDPLDHPYVDIDVYHPLHFDADGDGFSDAVENLMDTDPLDPFSHPDVVEAHHFPAGSNINLSGTFDVQLDLPW